MITVSILMTVYNREAYLSEAVESVLASSYTDWELIIVDDNSSDNSMAIAQEYASNDSRITAYKNDCNIGDYPNRNKAASYAGGKYIKYLDADDLIYPYSLQIMTDAMERFPEAALGLSCNIIDDVTPYPQMITPGEAYHSFFLGRNALGVGPSGAIIRRSLFKQAGGFSGRQYIGDTELWLTLAAMAPVVKLQPSLVWWRQHEGQQIAHERKNREILNVRYLLKMRVLENCGDLLTSEEKNKAERFHIFRHCRAIWNLALRQRQPKSALALYRESGVGICHMLKALMPYLI